MALRASICQRKQVDLYVRLVRLIAEIVMPNESVKVIWTGEPRVELIVRYLRLLGQIFAECCATRVVCSSVVPLGMSITTWNSLLLSKGSIFTWTNLSGTSETAASRRTTMLRMNRYRHFAECIIGVINCRYKPVAQSSFS